MFNNIKIATSPLSKEQKRLLKQLIKNNGFTIPMDVFYYYRNKIKNNTRDKLELIRKKLVRNIVLGKKIEEEGFSEIYQYGNLTIEYFEQLNEVISIHNVKGVKGKYYFDNSKEQLNKKRWLEKFLKINNSKN